MAAICNSTDPPGPTVDQVEAAMIEAGIENPRVYINGPIVGEITPNWTKKLAKRLTMTTNVHQLTRQRQTAAVLFLGGCGLTILLVLIGLAGCAHLNLQGTAEAIVPCLSESTAEAFAECAAIPLGNEAIEAAWKAAKLDPEKIPELVAECATVKE